MRRLAILFTLAAVLASLLAVNVDAAKCRTHCVRKCTPTKARRVARVAQPAKVAAGPVVKAPVINVPACPACPQAVVNVPQQPAPQVFAPQTAITTDDCYVYIVRDNDMLVLDKNTFCLKSRIALNNYVPSGSPSAFGAGPMQKSGAAMPGTAQPGNGYKTPSAMPAMPGAGPQAPGTQQQIQAPKTDSGVTLQTPQSSLSAPAVPAMPKTPPTTITAPGATITKPGF